MGLKILATPRTMSRLIRPSSSRPLWMKIIPKSPKIRIMLLYRMGLPHFPFRRTNRLFHTRSLASHR